MFPQRATVSDILDSYVGRRVYSESDLIHALSDESVRRIIIAGDFETTQTITFWRDGVSVLGAGGAIIRSGANPVFRLNANDLGFHDVSVVGTNSDREAPLVFGTLTDGTNMLERLVVDGCHFRAARLLEGIPGGTPHGVRHARIVNNHFDWVTPPVDGVEYIRASLAWSLVSGNVWTFTGGETPAFVYVTGPGNAVNGNSLGFGSAKVSGSTSVNGNTLLHAVVVHSSSGASIIGNAMTGGGITTTSSSGGNVVMGNTGTGTLTLHASDFYQTATDGDPLNKT